MRFLAMTALFVLAATSPAAAQTAAATPQAMSDVYACAEIADDVQRLACFDRAVGSMRQAEAEGQLVAVDRGQAEELERESFGFRLPSLSRLLPSMDGGDRDLDNVEMTVARVRALANGYHAFVMENDQVWAQVEPQGVRNVRAGDTVRIERAALGSFRLISPRGGAGHRVRRES